MILAFDTYYRDPVAHTVCIAFRDWTQPEPDAIYRETRSGIAAYEPGAFYKRELPCILSLLQQLDLREVTAILIDGFVYLDDDHKPGLGAHLYTALAERVPVIGVAKTNFATLHALKQPLLRGSSDRPLYITAIGIDVSLAAQQIGQMDGIFRMPTLLKLLDQHTRTLD
ncbi:MAG: endonuclease V [Sphingobacteriales bacterium]|nr:MAG: endonuclease V [Sphingobacteriales bacterium]